MQLKSGVVTNRVVITYEEGIYVMTNAEGVIIAVDDKNTFAMSRYAFERCAKQVVHNYGICSSGIPYAI